MIEQPPTLPLPPPPAMPTSANVTGPTVLRTDGMAIAALVVGVIAPIACLFDGVPGVLLGSVAVFLGLNSRSRIKRSGGALQGDGLAHAGWIVGLCAIVLGLAIAVLLFLAMRSFLVSGGGKGGPPPLP